MRLLYRVMGGPMRTLRWVEIEIGGVEGDIEISKYWNKWTFKLVNIGIGEYFDW